MASKLPPFLSQKLFSSAATFLCIALCPLSTHGGTTNYDYPAGAIVVDVTQPPYNADRSGVADSTASIQLAIDRASQDGISGDGIADDGTDDGYQDGTSRTRPRVVFFPDGIYRITNSLTGPALNSNQAGGLIILQGRSRAGAILRLDASASGFGSAATPKPVFSNFVGDFTNNAFMNGVENLTIEVGSGNQGAIGLQFGDNNCGYVRGVTIRSLDPQGAGAVGLHLSPGSSTTNPSGIGLIQDVAIEGFAIGVDTTRGFQMPWVFDRLALSNQSVVGILNANRPLSINALSSHNSVPAVRSTGASGHVVILNSLLTGGASSQPALDLQAGHAFIRDVQSVGYSTTLRFAGVNQPQDLTADEFVSGPVLKLWETTPSRSLDLPIVSAPDVPWDATGDWHVVAPATGDATADTAALQAALSSGKSSILLSPGMYRINATLTIGVNVRRIVGNWATLRQDLSLKLQDLPIFQFSTSHHPTVLIEKLQGYWNDATSYLIHHASNADLILRDIFWVAGPVYRNTRGTGGRLFLENIHSLGGGQTPREGRPAFVFDHQQVWARQINPEMQHPHMINDGGQLWILGFKTGEQRGPVVLTRNGGFTEILGGVQNMTHDNAPTDPENTSLLEIENANVSAVLLERFEGVGSSGGMGWGNNACVARETRGAETRILRPPVVYRASGDTAYSSSVPVRQGQFGSVLPLYVGYQTGAVVSALLPRLREDAPATATFVISRDTPFTDQPLTLQYSLAGTSISGVDFVALSGNITIPIGQSASTVEVDPLDRSEILTARTLTLNLLPSAGYILGAQTSATVEIVSEGLLSHSEVAVALPPGTSRQIDLTLFNPEPNPISYTLSGVATAYTVEHRQSLPGDSITLPAGKTELFVSKPKDDQGEDVTLPFSFLFYGQTYSSVHVCTNGFISFDINSSNWLLNRNLPTSVSAPRPVIAAYWDDLYLDSSSKVYHRAVHLDADTTPDAWVLEVLDATTYATRNKQIPERLSYQLWLLRDGTVRIAYLQSTITSLSYTIGIQNAAGTEGVRLIYDGSGPAAIPSVPLPPAYRAQAGTTVHFHPPVSWVSLPSSPLVVPANSQLNFFLNFSAAGLPDASYREATLSLTSSLGVLALPVSLVVTNGPIPPTNFTAVTSSASQINLSWNDSPNETSYQIERSADGNTNWNLLVTLPAGTLNYADVGLAAQTPHYYRIRATNAEGTSNWSPTASATTLAAPTPPVAASGLAATAASGGTITLIWNDNSTNETGFRIERATDGMNFSTLSTTVSGVTTFQDTGLAPATTYTYRIVALNTVGEASPSNSASATTPLVTTLLAGPTATWYRGRTGSSPTSGVNTLGSSVTLFSGGANLATDTQTPFWSYFGPITLAEGEILRLRATLQWNGALPTVGQGFSLGLVNSNGSKLLGNVSGNNPAERRDDAGYGFTLGLGGNTTTRYIHEPIALTTNGPWGNIDNATSTLVLGSTPATTSLADTASHAFELTLERNGTGLEIRVTLDGVEYDGGRTVATAETFTFDSLALVLRREACTISLTDLVVEHSSALSAVQQWRLTHFGASEGIGTAADTADPDNDGRNNLLEYALGCDPLDSNQSGGDELSLFSERLTLSFLRARAEILYEVLASSDLQGWTVIATNPGVVGEEVLVEDTELLTGQPRRFLRLRVSLP